jgi:nucleoside-diphosphate-sugar epimerase
MVILKILLYWKGESFDLCYHLAALARIQPSFDDPMETFRVDTQGVMVVAEWARQNNVKVVYSGSSSKWCNPETSPYATCKKLGEDVLKCIELLMVVILRLHDSIMYMDQMN